jgi:hypothetical protein
VPAVARFIVDKGLGARVILAKDVSEETLYALHAYAAATTVPTLFEGGFPWQALEGDADGYSSHPFKHRCRIREIIGFRDQFRRPAPFRA